MKGQIFSIDLLLSVSVFLGVMTVGILVLDDVVTSQTRFNDQYQLQQRATQIADLFVRTNGYPTNWNSSSVEVIGFAKQSHVMNMSKFYQFDELMETGDAAAILQIHPWNIFMDVQQDGEDVVLGDAAGAGGTGRPPVAYIAEESDAFSDVKVLHALNGSDVTWDLYWPSENNRDQLDDLTARHIYNMTNDGPILTDMMLANISSGSYDTVIAEDINLDSSDLTNEDALVSHVEEGGTMIHSEDKPVLIENLFGLDAAGGEDETGEVVATSPLLNQSLAVGDIIEFDDAQMTFQNVSERFINDTDEPYGCLACRWSVGEGDLYYLADTFGTNGDTMSFTDGSVGIDLGLELTFGQEPGEEALDIAVSRRSVLLDINGSIERGEMRVMLWR